MTRQGLPKPTAPRRADLMGRVEACGRGKCGAEPEEIGVRHQTEITALLIGLRNDLPKS